MDAPKKIYICPSDLAGIDYEEEWLEFPWGDNNIEYTRTDAFTNKACDTYCNFCGHDSIKSENRKCRQDCGYYKAFKKAMEEEENERI